VYSSAGAFGFYPWIDAATGRWGVVALQRSLLARPARDSVQLILDARGLIDAAHEADRAGCGARSARGFRARRRC
jgi:hypothetical protein